MFSTLKRELNDVFTFAIENIFCSLRFEIPWEPTGPQSLNFQCIDDFKIGVTLYLIIYLLPAHWHTGPAKIIMMKNRQVGRSYTMSPCSRQQAQLVLPNRTTKSLAYEKNQTVNGTRST